MAKIGRPPKEDRSEIRSEVLPIIRVTKDEGETIRAAAEADGRTLAAWVREALLTKARRILRRK